MHFSYSPQFRKRYAKLPKKVQARVDSRLLLFVKEPLHPLLKNHKLHGEYDDYRSINASGDLRIIYKTTKGGTVLLFALGTHHELYE